MTTAFVAVFLFVHGLVHLPDCPESGGEAEAGEGTAAIALASSAAILYVIAGAAAAVQSCGLY